MCPAGRGAAAAVELQIQKGPGGPGRLPPSRIPAQGGALSASRELCRAVLCCVILKASPQAGGPGNKDGA